VVGLSVAATRPDLLHAYIGMGQYVDPLRGERESFRWTLEQARGDGNRQAVAELEALQPYPGDFSIERIDAERKWAVHYGGLFHRRDNGDFYFNLARLSPEYAPADRKAWGEGSAFTVKIVEPQLAAWKYANVPELQCPLLLLEGRHDQLVPSAITAQWFAALRAPRKKLVWFENSAHMMMIEEPGRTLQALVDEALPIAASR
jgi:pimeloyl-ACP methyl ester carboxylesterase